MSNPECDYGRGTQGDDRNKGGRKKKQEKGGRVRDVLNVKKWPTKS